MDMSIFTILLVQAPIASSIGTTTMSTSASLTGLTENTTYYFWVRAIL